MMRLKITYGSGTTGMFSIASGTTSVHLDARTEEEMDTLTSCALTILQGLGAAQRFDLEHVTVTTADDGPDVKFDAGPDADEQAQRDVPHGWTTRAPEPRDDTDAAPLSSPWDEGDMPMEEPKGYPEPMDGPAEEMGDPGPVRPRNPRRVKDSPQA